MELSAKNKLIKNLLSDQLFVSFNLSNEQRYQFILPGLCPDSLCARWLTVRMEKKNDLSIADGQVRPQ